MKDTNIRYQLTELNWKEITRIMEDLKKVIYIETIWSQVDNSPTHEKHKVRCLVEQLKEALEKKKEVIKTPGNKNLWEYKDKPERYKGQSCSFKYQCPHNHDHEINIVRTPFNSMTPTYRRIYEISNYWDRALSEYSDTNGYTMEEWQKDKEADQILKNCPAFTDYPKTGKYADKVWTKLDKEWIKKFEDDASIDKEKF